MNKKFKIRKGDQVVVITGKDRGKTGTVLKVIPDEDKVIVGGVGVVKRHTKQTQTQPGGIIEKELPVHISNVAHVDPSTQKPTRVGIRIEDGKKVLFAKKSGDLIQRGTV